MRRFFSLQLPVLFGLMFTLTAVAALVLIPSGFMFAAFDFLSSPLSLSIGAGVALTVGTSKFFLPKIKAFLDSVITRTPDRYAINGT